MALSACDAGFHMASRNELGGFDLSYTPADAQGALFVYDRTRGVVAPDSGFGPPTSEYGSVGVNDYWGWLRSGGRASIGPGYGANCNVWSTASPDAEGILFSFGASALETETCDAEHHVWCVQD